MMNIGKKALLVGFILALIVWVNTLFVFTGAESALIDRLAYATIVAISAWVTITVFMYSFYWLYMGLKK